MHCSVHMQNGGGWFVRSVLSDSVILSSSVIFFFSRDDLLLNGYDGMIEYQISVQACDYTLLLLTNIFLTCTGRGNTRYEL
jgi:hypothetical protein